MFSNKLKKTIYLDNAATTPIDTAVLDTMMPYLTSSYANPSALYKSGKDAAKAIEEARRQIAKTLFAQSDTITFTGSATEANNMTLFGIARANTSNGKHIITAKTEHKAVLAPCKQLEREGFEITYLAVDEFGQVDMQELKDTVRPDTILISLMYANNEVGTITPIAEIGKYLLQYRKKNDTTYPLLHTDACQAVNYLDMSVERLHADALTLNGSKIYGPKGIGALYIRRGIAIEPIIFGGGQENGLRSGTESVAAIVGLGAAIEKAATLRDVEIERLQTLQQYFWQQLEETFGDDVMLNGPGIVNNALNRLPNNINVSFSNFEGEQIVLYLDAKGIYTSTGSACTTESEDASQVLDAMGYDKIRQYGSVRFTMGRSTSTKDIDVTIKELSNITKLLV